MYFFFNIYERSSIWKWYSVVNVIICLQVCNRVQRLFDIYEPKLDQLSSQCRSTGGTFDVDKLTHHLAPAAAAKKKKMIKRKNVMAKAKSGKSKQTDDFADIFNEDGEEWMEGNEDDRRAIGNKVPNVSFVTYSVWLGSFMLVSLNE